MTLLPVFAGLVVGWVALRGLLTHPRLPLWAKTGVFWTVPVAAGAWLVIMVADDASLFPETAPCPREPYQEGVIGSGAVRGVSTPFPPRAYCAWEDGTTYELAAGPQFVFWVCFTVTVVLLGAGLWQSLRDPKSLLH